ncbi:MAG: hypothetical protein Q4C85_09835, partial [Actinomyces sp.]|uniref:hypothetical protein n=1 Tax=Actinomyces sp. TaxID=29317 RepID=UPI0026DBFDEE
MINSVMSDMLGPFPWVVADGLRAAAPPPAPHVTWLAPVSVLLVVLLVLVALGWSLYAKALRVDRLHRQVLGSRATLEAQLVHRAQAAADLAHTGLMDPASCLILLRAARRALDAEGPVVDDGLDPERSGAGAQDASGRDLIESELSRVIRTIVDRTVRQALHADPAGGEALARLDRGCYRLVLARRFHNTHVAEARRLREGLAVRLAHLAGHAPMPQTFDIDDETMPPAGAPGAPPAPRRGARPPPA